MTTRNAIRIRIFYLAAVLCFFAGMARAQQQPPGDDLFGRSFFTPEIVMRNQEAIGLTDDQKAQLKSELRAAQTKFMDLQWKLQDEGEKLVNMVKQPHADEQQVLAQVDRVLAAERDIKRAQVSLLLHIKNNLTPEQQAKLEEIRHGK